MAQTPATQHYMLQLTSEIHILSHKSSEQADKEIMFVLKEHSLKIDGLKHRSPDFQACA